MIKGVKPKDLSTTPVLLSWIAVNNDPFERDTRSGEYQRIGEALAPGPTLTLLFDEESPYRGRVQDIVLFYRRGFEGGKNEERIVEETIIAIKERCDQISVRKEGWSGKDPTDHKSIFEFLRATIPRVRRAYEGRELLIHISPGTPSMQTIWILMAETGFIESPFRVVKSYRKRERQGRGAVVAVEVGLETFYKAYRSSKPAQLGSEDDIVFWDPAKFQTDSLKSLFLQARRFASLKVPVLIMGERGTGKTTLASWIRLHSPYRRSEQDVDWPAVACGQYSPETMRAELFGYLQGAFTDAKSDRDGLLVRADRDTLFLDEIGDISSELQRLLIKALEDKKYLPLGGIQTRHSDFRLLTATNLPERELRERLDADFLDRISLLRLRVPSIRELRSDLPWLWDSVYRIAIQRSGAASNRALLSDAQNKKVVVAFAQHPLPGNLRDLFRVAYHILAALLDDFTPVSKEDAVEYGLLSLNDTEFPTDSRNELIRDVARSFADAAPLDGVLQSGGALSMEVLDRELKRYLATEIRRIAKARKISTNELCDVTDRALRKWVGAADSE